MANKKSASSPRATTVWKVVHKRNGRWGSVVVGRGPFHVKYPVGKWVKAPLNGLLCFKTLGDAQCYAYYYGGTIFECEATGKKRLFAQRLAFDLELLKSVDEYKRARSNGKYVWPNGTVVYEKVRLVRKANQGKEKE